VEIVLVRHAEPEWVKDGINYDNPPLTERGFRQAEMLADSLRGESFAEFHVSPLVRAQQTSDPIASVVSADRVTSHWLEEIRSEIWHGTPAEKAEEAFRKVRTLPSQQRWIGLEGGETVRDFVDRIHLGAEIFLREHGITRMDSDLPVWEITDPGASILLVAHAGTNSVVISHLLGLSTVPWEWDRFVLGHTSVTRIEAMKLGDGYTFCLSRLSDVEHLPTSMRTR
jgi:2,3-bisphosphoglycerate-dependent phosphoglycerate mutase